ncbi:O-antigen polymerase [Aeromonas bivalvium]|uniref:O-antigen polymerase n=1 Tax=Aeromonas bivalvium TaxID=440079 RepID=UPI0009FF8FEF|nr:O-antigen polymerase [Aeromonas bivalvium]
MKVNHLFWLCTINVMIFYYFIDLTNKVDGDMVTVIISLVTLNMICAASFYLYRSIFNPITILSPLALGLFYHQFNLSSRQEVFYTETIINISLFFVFYIFGCVLFFSKKINVLDRVESPLRVHLFFVIGTIVFFIESYLNNGLAIIKTLSGANAYIENNAIPIFHYFYMMIALLPSCYYYFYKRKKLSKGFYLLISTACFFMIFNSLSRQLILLCIFSTFFAYINFNNMKIDKPIIKLGVFIAVFFILVGSIRYIGFGKEGVSELDYMKAYSGIESDLDVNMFDVTFNLYTTQNFSTLNNIINTNESELHFGKYLLQAYLKILNIDRALDIKFNSELDSYTRLGTIIADLYLDFGIASVILQAFIYGLIVNFTYSNFINSQSLSATLVFSVVFFVIFMSPFTNYFNQFFIMLCLIYSVSFRYKFTLWR